MARVHEINMAIGNMVEYMDISCDIFSEEFTLINDTDSETATGNTGRCLSPIRNWDTVAFCLFTMHSTTVNTIGMTRDAKRMIKSGIVSNMAIMRVVT